MDHPFEKEKNIKALAYTSVVCILLFIVFFFAQWTLPQIPAPIVEEGIEVNLGNSETGLGDEAPMIPGKPTITEETNFTPPPPVAQSQPVDEPDIDADENEPEDVPAIRKVEKPVTKPARNEPKVVSKPVEKPQPAAIPTTKPPSPKAVYRGGTSSDAGGNNADSYNKSRNQGVAGGRGDQGSPNGNPNSDSYKGNGGSGSGGVRIRSGLSGRSILRVPRFEDDFNENAKVAVDIVISPAGKVISAAVNPRGTTTTNANTRRIATQAAMKIPFSAGTEEQRGTIIVDLRVSG